MEQIRSFLINSVEEKESLPTIYDLVMAEHCRLVEIRASGSFPSVQEVELLTTAMCEFDFIDMDERHQLWSCLTFWEGKPGAVSSGLKPLSDSE